MALIAALIIGSIVASFIINMEHKLNRKEVTNHE